jgi:large subunit ribosomal protein L21
MFAIVASCGKQYKVAVGDLVVVDQLAADPGATVELDQVLMLVGESTTVGTPTVPGAKVVAKVVEHFLGEKTHGMKYMRTRRFRRRFGSRHRHTRLEIVSIDA